MLMQDAYEEIMDILYKIESKNNLPKDTLKQIYDAENSMVHLRVRENIHDHLQGIVSAATGKMKDAV